MVRSKYMDSSDQAAWVQFVEEYYPRIYAFCVQSLNSGAEGEDATQNVFLKAWSSWSSLRDYSKVKGWIYAIARNEIVDRARWWKRALSRIGRDPIEQPDVGDPDLVLSLRRLIGNLPVRQREVFILRHYHGFTTEETAALLGIDGGSVKSHLSRAIHSIRAELSEKR